MPSRFEFVKFNDESKAAHSEFTEKFKQLEQDILTIRSNPYRFEAMKSLEACYMWVGKAIRQEQIQRSYDLKEQAKIDAEAQKGTASANDSQVQA